MRLWSCGERLAMDPEQPKKVVGLGYLNLIRCGWTSEDGKEDDGDVREMG